jgi:hypothetical protein
MTALSRTPENTNFLQPTKFTVSFTRIPTVQYFCQSANMPGVGMNQVPRSTPFLDIKAPGRKLNYNEFKMTFLVDEYLLGWKELYDWFLSMASPAGFEERNRLSEIQNQKNFDKNTSFSDFVLTINSGLNNSTTRVQFYNAFPISLSDIELDVKLSADTQSIAAASFYYEYFTFIT